MTEVSEHSELPPSSSDKWFNCHAWRRLNHGLPDQSSAAAEEGTLAHEWLADCLLGKRTLAECDNREMADYLAEVQDWVEAQPGELHVETKVDFGETFGFVGLTGTADVILVDDESITIADLKYGKGMVEADRNLQLMTYLIGAVHRFGQRPSYRLSILQPRAWHEHGPIRSWVLGNETMLQFRLELGEAIKANYDPRSKPVAGDWCRKFCKALGSCPAAAMRSLDLFRNNPVEDDDAA